jgi:hypothetical protein
MPRRAEQDGERHDSGHRAGESREPPHDAALPARLSCFGAHFSVVVHIA